MWETCYHVSSMSKMIQVRDVPEELHTALKVRAAREGMSLSDYIKKELEAIASRPTLREWLERTQCNKSLAPGASGAKVIRELRDSR
jgi:antitoxin FitA